MDPAEPGWRPDPGGRHELRYWDGTAWTQAVVDQGVESVDAMVPAAPARPHDTHSRDLRPTAIAVWVLVVALAGVLVGVIATRGGGSEGSDDSPAPDASASPRDGLLTLGDLPAGWVEAAVQGPSDAQLLCGRQAPESPEPNREANASFDRDDGTGTLSHQVIEATPAYASEFVDQAMESASACETWTTEGRSGGTTYRGRSTAEVMNGPSLGDETAWFRVETAFDNGTDLEYIICIDRHAGALSILTISGPMPLDGDTEALVESLAGTVSNQLTP